MTNENSSPHILTLTAKFSIFTIAYNLIIYKIASDDLGDARWILRIFAPSPCCRSSVLADEQGLSSNKKCSTTNRSSFFRFF